MAVWIFILSGVLIVSASILALAGDVMASHTYHSVWMRADSPFRPTWKQLFRFILIYSCIGMAGSWLAAIQHRLKPPASVPAPVVIQERLQPIYITPDSSPAQQEATPNPKNALTKVEPPSDTFSNQNVPPIPPAELAKRQELAKKQEIAREDLAKEERAKEELAARESAKQLEEEKRKRFFDQLHRETGVPY